MVARPDDLRSWHDDWSGLRVLVLGLGVTGFAVADTLAELGCRVHVAAHRPDEDRARILPVIGVELIELTALDAVPPAFDALALDLVIVSPGFLPDHPHVMWARERNLPLWGDIELAWRVRDKVAPPADCIMA